MRWALLILAFGMVSSLAPAPSAQAVVVVQEGERAGHRFIGALGCDSDSVSLAAPRGATHVEALSPPLGAMLHAIGDEYEETETRGFATVTNVQVTYRGAVPVLGWTVTPEPALCGPVFDWSTGDTRVSLTYRLRTRVSLSRRDAAELAEEAVERRFPYYPNYSGSGLRCRHAPNRGRCKVSFWAGDTSFAGVVKVALSASADHRRLLWSYRLRIVRTNEYCVHVTHEFPCSETYRKRRQRMPAPGWLRP